MPRSTRKRLPQYRHYKARNLACVDINGQRFYLGPYKSKASYVEYDRLIAEWLAHGRVLPQEHGEPDRITVVELIAAYLEYAAGYYRKDGKQTGEYPCIVAAVRPLREYYGREAAEDFDQLKLQAVRETLLLTNARRTTNKHVGRVKRMFRWAASRKLIPGSLVHDLNSVDAIEAGRHPGARETVPIGPVDDAVVDATLPHLPAVVAGMVRFQLYTGCRPQEVAILRPMDVDRSKDPWIYTPSSHKTEHHGKVRRIFIGPKAADIIRPRLLRPEGDYCFSPREVRKDAGPRYTTDSYRRAIVRVCERKGIEPWAPNQLRHRMATKTREVYGLEAVAAALGHSRLSTSEVYAEKSMALAARVAVEVG